GRSGRSTRWRGPRSARHADPGSVRPDEHPTGRPMSHVLGLDISTTATKAVLVDGSGAVVGIGVAEYPFDTPQPLWSEQEPGLWWTGAVAAIRSVLSSAGIRGDAVDAIGLAGQMH